jgi:hypothetical protein
VTARFDIVLSLAFIGSGGGRVVSAPAGLDCVESCSAAIASNTLVTLTAQPDASSEFLGFAGDPDCEDGSVLLDVSRRCVAIFRDLAETWNASFAGPDGAADAPTGLALLPGGDLAVTGLGGDDIVTIRYDASGTVLWTERWDGPAGGRDFAGAVASDAAGNVYVAGSSEGTASGFDIVVLKYLPGGTLDWAERYDGPASGGDFGHAIAVDAAGRVLVGGRAERPGVDADFVTLAYSPGGTLLWDEFYGSGGEVDWRDEITSLVVDSNGDVVVGGDSFSGLEDDLYFNNDLSDYATVKYDAGGSRRWVRRYDGPDLDSSDHLRDLALGPDDSVHVTGLSRSDAVTVKYLADGSEDWTRSVPNSTAEAVFVDTAGNVYVTGSQHTTKYDPDGVELWSRNDGLYGRDVVVDGAGNVFVVGARDGMTVLQYDAGGTLVWEGRYRGTTGLGISRVAIDAFGRLDVSGRQSGEDGSADYLTLQYGGLAAAACSQVGAWPRSTSVLAAQQENSCEDWSGVSQPGDDLQLAVLVWTDLGAADLTGANLSGADLSGAKLTSAVLTGANLEGALYDELTLFPSGSPVESGSWGLPGGAAPWALGMVPVPEPSCSPVLAFGVAGLAWGAIKRRSGCRAMG